MRTEVVSDATRAGADFEHANGLRSTGKVQQTFDLKALEAPRRQIEHGMRLALGCPSVRVRGLMMGWNLRHATHPQQASQTFVEHRPCLAGGKFAAGRDRRDFAWMREVADHGCPQFG